jgi:hypothetical protein
MQLKVAEARATQTIAYHPISGPTVMTWSGFDGVLRFRELDRLNPDARLSLVSESGPEASAGVGPNDDDLQVRIRIGCRTRLHWPRRAPDAQLRVPNDLDGSHESYDGARERGRAQSCSNRGARHPIRKSPSPLRVVNPVSNPTPPARRVPERPKHRPHTKNEDHDKVDHRTYAVLPVPTPGGTLPQLGAPSRRFVRVSDAGSLCATAKGGRRRSSVGPREREVVAPL